MFASLAALVAGAWAQQPDSGGPRGAGKFWKQPGQNRPQGGFEGQGMEVLLRNPELGKQVGLTDEQSAALKASNYQYEQESISLKAKAEQARLEVRKLMDTDAPDEAAVMQAVDKAAQAQAELQTARLRHMLAVKKLLGKDGLDKIRKATRERWRMAKTQGERRGPGPAGATPPPGTKE